MAMQDLHNISTPPSPLTDRPSDKSGSAAAIFGNSLFAQRHRPALGLASALSATAPALLISRDSKNFSLLSLSTKLTSNLPEKYSTPLTTPEATKSSTNKLEHHTPPWETPTAKTPPTTTPPPPPPTPLTTPPNTRPRHQTSTPAP